MTQQTVTVRLAGGKGFATGLKYAKQQGGRFDATTKLWTLPVTAQVERMLNAPAAYGWVVVGRGGNEGQIDRCPLYTAEQGCPLHGEVCA